MEMHETSLYADMFAALGSDQRLEIMRLLIRNGEKGLTVGDIQGKLGIPNSTLSHHLEKLRHEGLVASRKDRQWIWYTVDLETVGKLITFLCAKCYKPDRLAKVLEGIGHECERKEKKKERKS